VGINNHLKIGDGAQVYRDERGQGRHPAQRSLGRPLCQPTKQWFREIIAVERLVRDATADTKDEGRE